jgi:hypothetical protein
LNYYEIKLNRRFKSHVRGILQLTTKISFAIALENDSIPDRFCKKIFIKEKSKGMIVLLCNLNIDSGGWLNINDRCAMSNLALFAITSIKHDSLCCIE